MKIAVSKWLFKKSVSLYNYWWLENIWMIRFLIIPSRWLGWECVSRAKWPRESKRQRRGWEQPYSQRCFSRRDDHVFTFILWCPHGKKLFLLEFFSRKCLWHSLCSRSAWNIYEVFPCNNFPTLCRVTNNLIKQLQLMLLRIRWWWNFPSLQSM